MPVAVPPHPLPEGFARAVAELGQVTVRPEVVVEESPAPQRLAPYAIALQAEVVVGQDELATGRLVVLHDPDEPEAWGGPTRMVAYARAPLDREMAADPLLPAVGWSWLVDALTTVGAEHANAGGTVTRVASERFGALAGHPDVAEVELRASWTPAGPDLRPHLHAFAELLCMAAGLPPTAPGVTPMPRRRKRTAPRPARD